MEVGLYRLRPLPVSGAERKNDILDAFGSRTKSIQLSGLVGQVIIASLAVHF